MNVTRLPYSITDPHHLENQHKQYQQAQKCPVFLMLQILLSIERR
jgi:hypothetical protein